MNDERLEQIVGNLLRIGVLLAAGIVLAGGVWYLADAGMGQRDYGHFHAEVRGLQALGSLRGPEAVIFIGLLILIATPVARVIFSLVAFRLERDRMYVGFTAVVLVILLYSIVSGAH